MASKYRKPLRSYHQAWLKAHPHRSEEWLRMRTKDGFDVHHLDGDKGNESPDNLVLIEHTDHMMLHGGRTLGRLTPGSGMPQKLRQTPEAKKAKAAAARKAKTAKAKDAKKVRHVGRLVEPRRSRRITVAVLNLGALNPLAEPLTDFAQASKVEGPRFPRNEFSEVMAERIRVWKEQRAS